jgi:hypothetical protein
MASNPHDKTGKICNCCGKVFTAQSFTITIAKRIPGFVTRMLVCGPCHHEYYQSKGE